MPVIPGLEGTFNTVCAEYDRWRPTYVPELYEDIFAAAPIGPGSNAIEVGIGTGQATLPVLARGCTLTAVELGDQMAEFARQKFRSYPKFSVVNLPFQDFDAPANSCDLIYSASAFHWVPEEIGYKKAFDLLRPGGVFARFANHPFKDKGRPGLYEAMQEHYAVYMPGSHGPTEYSEEAARSRAEIAAKYGFADISYKLYRRTRTFSAAEYIRLLGTYSDHIAIEETRRREFFSRIEQTILDFGGKITIYDTLDLQLARKP